MVDVTDKATDTPCTKCGEPHPKCTAHRKTDGRPCGGQPVTGMTVCRKHGGSTPQAKAAAKRRIEAMTAEKALDTYGLPRGEGDPRDLLLEELLRTAGHVDWLRALIADLDPDALVEGVTKTTVSTVHGATRETKTAPSVWLELYHRERRHLREVARDAAAAGVEERRIRLAEEHGRVIVQVLRASLADMGVTIDDDVSSIVGRHLRAFAAGDGPELS